MARFPAKTIHTIRYSRKTKRYRIRDFIKRGVCAGAAVALVASFAPAAAFADTTYSAQHVTYAASKAADGLGDMLGMDQVEGSNPNTNYTSTMGQGVLANDNAYLVFGSSANSNPDPTYNGLKSFWTAIGGATYPTVSQAATYGSLYTVGGGNIRNGVGEGPVQAFDTTTDAEFLTTYQPDVIIGNGDSNADPTDTETITVGDYTGDVVAFSTLSTEDLLKNATTIAAKADANATTAKPLRYSNTTATAIATKMSNYVNGQVGYIQKKIADETVSKPTVAVITAQNGSNFTLAKYAAGRGVNRYAEVIKDVAVNYAEDQDVTSASMLDILKQCDYILVSGAAGAGAGSIANNSSLIYAVQTAFEDAVDEAFEDDIDLQCSNFDTGVFYANAVNAGATFGTLMNSAENLQNYGRILPFIFPDLSSAGFTQDAAMTYFVREFYHIDTTSSTAISNVMSVLYGGTTDTAAKQFVRGDTTDGISYAPSTTSFENCLTQGVAYLAQ